MTRKLIWLLALSFSMLTLISFAANKTVAEEDRESSVNSQTRFVVFEIFTRGA